MSGDGVSPAAATKVQHNPAANGGTNRCLSAIRCVAAKTVGDFAAVENLKISNYITHTLTYSTLL